ncbi:MAG TPA: hypothetical protein VFG79_24620 [Solirubrobacter sp.]|jgi:hypothetical protein|nr:hypothetical protein [Solirubrobacter sp.]
MTRAHIRSLGAVLGAAALLAGLTAPAGPALAASITDGTSNTIMFGVAPAGPRAAAAIHYNGHADFVTAPA